MDNQLGEMSMTAFVLVHGSSCGGWVWQKLAPLLRAGGHEVYTPTLSGLSDRSHLADCSIDLNTHITDITRLIQNEDLSQVVLVGHSYAGMVITGVAEKIPEKLGHLVYLDAYLPDDGQSEADLWPPDLRSEIMAGEASQRGVRQPPSAAFLGITDAALEQWVSTRLTPHPLACYTQPVIVRESMYSSMTPAFILCTKGPTTKVFSPFASKARTKGWRVYEMPTGHIVMLTMPNELATLLHNIASIER